MPRRLRLPPRPPLTRLGWVLAAAVTLLVGLALTAPQRLAGVAWAVLAVMLIAWVGSWSSVRTSREARRRARRGRGHGHGPRA